MCNFVPEMDIFAQTPIQSILFLILYGVTGVMPLFAAVYLLLRRGNAFAPDITPPVRLRRWAASFFAMSALGHVWWLLFYFRFRNFHSVDDVLHSASYVAIVVFDCVALLTTLAGTLLSMLQDRRRRVWPVFVALIPFMALGGVCMVKPSQAIMFIASLYIQLLYVLFTVYMVFAVRGYGRWLNDNYADLENKKVWLSQVVTLVCLLLFILYFLVDSILFMYLMHFTEIVLFSLLLWRVETLPQLDGIPMSEALPLSGSMATEEADSASTSKTAEAPAVLAKAEAPAVSAMAQAPDVPPQKQLASATPINIDIDQIEQQLKEHCVATQLYLQHDLTLQELAQTIGTNRSYLSLYFSRQGITYNIYINNLRINYFISRYQEAARAGRPVIAQQLASDSGYRSYSTFSLAFKQRMGQSVTAWMRETGE